MKKNLVRKSEQIVRITLLLILLTQFHGALKSQFSNVKDLRQQIKSGTYNKNLIVPKGVLVVCKNATVKFGTGYGIIVKRGGTLYLDNCTITHANDNFTISVTNKYSSIKSVQLSIASFSNITPFYNNIINVLPGTTATINISTNNN